MIQQLDKAVRALRQRRDDLAHGVMSRPPADYGQFMKQVGMYCEVDTILNTLEPLLKGIEDD